MGRPEYVCLPHWCLDDETDLENLPKKKSEYRVLRPTEIDIVRRKVCFWDSYCLLPSSSALRVCGRVVGVMAGIDHFQVVIEIRGLEQSHKSHWKTSEGLVSSQAWTYLVRGWVFWNSLSTTKICWPWPGFWSVIGTRRARFVEILANIHMHVYVSIYIYNKLECTWICVWVCLFCQRLREHGLLEFWVYFPWCSGFAEIDVFTCRWTRWIWTDSDLPTPDSSLCLFVTRKNASVNLQFCLSAILLKQNALALILQQPIAHNDPITFVSFWVSWSHTLDLSKVKKCHFFLFSASRSVFFLCIFLRAPACTLGMLWCSGWCCQSSLTETVTR